MRTTYVTMNMAMQKLSQLFWGVWLFVPVVAQCQGTFKNLNFESPLTPLVPIGPFNEVAATSAVPGWTVYLGTSIYPQVRYNQVSIGTAAVSLIGPGQANGVLEGAYTVALYPGPSPLAAERVSTSVEQSGEIPSDARSVSFDVILFAGVGQVSVSFLDHALAIVPLESAPAIPGSLQHVRFGADVSGFAGLFGALRFTVPPLTGYANTIYLDAIEFSSSPIPEPARGTLFALGVAAWLWPKQKRQRM
ncbi:MAG TPA: hypothetical protein VI136_01130 [Verrucomicrobiae bacterium]